MEIAVSLDPPTRWCAAILGKAYLEEGRNHLAEAEFELAKQLDPKDPTPSTVLSKHAENRQVEAIEELQQSSVAMTTVLCIGQGSYWMRMPRCTA